MRRIPSLLLFVLLGAVASTAWAANGAPAASPWLQSATMLGPLGISPFFAMGAFGLAAFLGLWTPPPGGEAFAHPFAFGLLLACGLILHFGRSSKFTKPLAELLGTGESFFAVVTLLMLAAPQLAPATKIEAGLGSALLFGLLAFATVGSLVVLRTALDVMIWLSPFPFVDAAFQVVKLFVTVALIALALWSPVVALIANGILLVVTLLLVRWAVRTARFGVTVGWDLVSRPFRAAAPMPRDPAVATDLGPFVAFAMDVTGCPRRTEVSLELDAGSWFMRVPQWLGEPRLVPLGDGKKGKLVPGWMGTELFLPGGVVLLPPRYRHLLESLRQESGAELQPGRFVPQKAPRVASAF